jgi:tetratricopeptide (TPR) repeat protein
MIEAESYLKRAIEKLPNLPESYYYLSQLHLIRHDYTNAIAAAERMIEIAPYWSHSHVVLGRCYLQAGDYQKAEAAFQESLQYGASQEETKHFLAQSLYLQNRFREAVEVMLEIADLEGKHARSAREDAARILLVLGEEEQAATLLGKAWAEKETPQTGIQYYAVLSRMGRYDEARKILGKMVSDRPFIIDGQLEQGNLYYKDRSYQPAYYAYQQVLDTEPANFWAQYNLGCLALARRDSYQAPNYFTTAMESNPMYFPAQINLALSELYAVENIFSTQIIDRLSSQFPNNPYLQQTKALKSFHTGDSRTAITLAQQSIEREEAKTRGLIILGEIHMRLFEYQEALHHFETALEAEPENARALLGKAHALFRLGDSEQAGAIYTAIFETGILTDTDFIAEVKNGLALVTLSNAGIADALNRWDLMKNEGGFAKNLALVNASLVDPNNPTESETADLELALLEKESVPEAYYNLALFQEKMGNQLEAIRHYESLLERYPTYLPGLYNIADLYRKRSRYPEANDFFDRTRKAAPDRADIINNQAAIYVKMGNPTKANELLALAVEKSPNSTTIRYNQALSALHEGNINKTRKHVEDLKTIGASTSSMLFLQGLLQAEQNQVVEAEKSFATAYKQTPNDVYTVLNYGISLATLEKYSEAETALREAISLDPSLPASHRALGLLYCKLGLFEEAEELLQISLRLDSSQNDLQKIVAQIQRWVTES